MNALFSRRSGRFVKDAVALSIPEPKLPQDGKLRKLLGEMGTCLTSGELTHVSPLVLGCAGEEAAEFREMYSYATDTMYERALFGVCFAANEARAAVQGGISGATDMI